jgi:hypothetical protein
MAFYSLNMLNIALELAKHRRIYEDIASKFFEHFLFISDAMTYRDGEKEKSLWNEEDGYVIPGRFLDATSGTNGITAVFTTMLFLTVALTLNRCL